MTKDVAIEFCLARVLDVSEILLLRDCNLDNVTDSCSRRESNRQTLYVCHTSCDSDGCNSEDVTSASSDTALSVPPFLMSSFIISFVVLKESVA